MMASHLSNCMPLGISVALDPTLRWWNGNLPKAEEMVKEMADTRRAGQATPSGSSASGAPASGSTQAIHSDVLGQPEKQLYSYMV